MQRGRGAAGKRASSRHGENFLDECCPPQKSGWLARRPRRVDRLEPRRRCRCRAPPRPPHSHPAHSPLTTPYGTVGTFLGESFLAFIAPSGFITLQYNPLNNGDVTTTTGRFTSWQCIDPASVPEPLRNMSVSRNIYDAVTYDMSGVIVSSATWCNIYVVDVDQGRQWTTGGENGACPSVATLDRAFVQGENSYVNTQLVNATIIRQPAPGDLVCGGRAANRTTETARTGPTAGQNPSPGLNVTTLPPVGTTLSGFPVSTSSSSYELPPELAGESIALSATNITTAATATVPGANTIYEVNVETLQVTNGEGYATIGLMGINGAPQRFSSVVARGIGYEYLNTSSRYAKTQSSVVYIDEDVAVTRYDPNSCTLIRLNADPLSGYRSTQFLNASVACPTAQDAADWKRSNTTDTVAVTKLASFPAAGAVRPDTGMASSAGASADGSSTAFELSIGRGEALDDSLSISYFTLNLTSATGVVGAEIRGAKDDKVVVDLVPSALGWPTAVVDGGEKTPPRLLGPISGSYATQGAFDSGDLEEGGEYYVSVRTEGSGSTAARADLVWQDDAGGGTGGGGTGGGGTGGGAGGAGGRPEGSGGSLLVGRTFLVLVAVFSCLLV